MASSDRTRAINAFLDRKFGLFMHWGLYSILGRGEWVQYLEKIPASEYEQLARQFTGEKFDADAIARLAIDAGMKYIVLTSKHHDGFCLFDSKLTDYTSAKTAAGRDFIGEIAEACHKHGLGFHPYYSLWDWHHPDFVPSDPVRWQRYLDYYRGQVRELCTNYGPVAGMWFDRGGGVEGDYDMSGTAVVAGETQPDAAIMCVDYWVGEKSARPTADMRPKLSGPAVEMLSTGCFEVCETVNDHYCCCPTDQNFKSVPYLWFYFLEVFGHGGNFLLNIGPMPDGTIDERSSETLRSLGSVVRRYGDAIYNTRAMVHPSVNPNGFTTVKDDRAFFFVTNLTPTLDSMIDQGDPLSSREGQAVLRFDGVRSKVAAVKPYGSGGSLDFRQDGTVLSVTVPRESMSWPQTVIEARMEGPAQVDGDIRPEPDGSFILSPRWAAIYTPSASEPRYFPQEGGLGRIGWWSEPRARVQWLLNLPQAGRYEVTIEQSCAGDSAGTPYEVRIVEPGLQVTSIIDWTSGEKNAVNPESGVAGATILKSEVKRTKSWTDCVSVPLGEADLPAGQVTVELMSRGSGKVFMDVWCIRLTPKSRE